MEQLLHDARYALRSMRRTPLVYVLAALSLALGIAANTSIFSALDAFLIRPLPYPAAESLVRIWSANPERGWNYWNVAPADYLDLRAQSRTAELAAYAGGSMNIAGDGEAERVTGTRTSANLFGVLGVRPVLGRGFLPEEERPGGARVVVIGDALWQRRFAGRPDALGSTLLLNGEPHEVVGIMSPHDHFPDRTTEIWTPLRLEDASDRTNRWLQLVGRMRAGVTVTQAREELAAIARGLEQAHPGSNAGMTVRVEDLAHAMFNEMFRTAAAICMVAVAFVLLIACANVANLLLARAAAREREIALRSVLGAGRWRVVRQLLTESVALGLVGGVLGVILSYWGVKWLLTIMPENTPMIHRVALNGRALGFTAAVAIGSGLLFGLAPALQATRPNLGSMLREAGGRGSTLGVRGGRLRSSFVVAEIGLALVLLVCAGLLIRGYRNVTAVEVGIHAEDVMTARIALPEALQYADTTRVIAFYDELAARLGAQPGVQQVTLASAVPLTGGMGTYYLAEGMTPVPEAERPTAQYRTISPGFFELFDIPLRQGRSFTAGDRYAGVPVVIVNEAFARRHWEGQSAIGRTIELSSGTREVVGVVADYHEWGGDEEEPAMMFLPVAQRPAHALAVAIRTQLPAERAVAVLREQVRALDPNLPLYQVRSMPEIMDRTYQQDRILARLLTIFAVMALVLAVLGVYGVMAYNASQRTQEVGIRMAIGAQAPDILRMMVLQGTVLALIGIAGGTLLAFGVSRFLAKFLFGVSPSDPATFLVVGVILFGAALVASYVPALRATRIDPVQALRVD